MSKTSKDQKSNNEIGYDRWAASYDTGLNSTVAVDDLEFPKYFAHLRQCRVLEIGSGTGRHTVRLAAQENRVIGVDLSSKMLEIARTRVDSRKVELIHADIMKMDLDSLCKDGHFDAAVSALVLEHLDHVSEFFKRLRDCLRPGASFYISEIHPLRAQRGRLAHFKDGVTGEEIWLESRFHSEDKVIEAAISSDFSLIKSVDALGTSALATINPNWVKYIGEPMVKIWEFKRH